MKKESAAWNIAATHFLTAGFAIPFVVSLVVGFALSLVAIDVKTLPGTLLLNIIWLVSVWLGVMYSARYLAKRYLVTDANKVVVLSTVYRLVLTVLFFGGSLLFGQQDSESVVNPTIAIVTIVFSLIGTAIFYVTSKKYVQQDAVAAPVVAAPAI